MTLFDVAVVGVHERTADALRAAGFNAVTVDPVSSSDFDESTHTWTLRTGDETHQARVVIEHPGRLVTPWVPELPGRNEFRGTVFHSAAWDAGFDPAGQRIAVIGTGAVPLLGELAPRAKAVNVFVQHRGWILQPGRPTVRRVLSRRRPEPVAANVEFIASGIDRITASGIHTTDGADHPVDVIIFATGFTVSGQTEAARGMQPFLGVAMHGLPNYFVLTGRGAGTEEQLQYLVECLKLMARRRGTRIEVRRSTQTVFNDRLATKVDSTVWRPRRPTRAAFDVSSSIAVEDEVYDGPATLRTGDDTHDVRVRLTGHLDPIDGRYHWQGLILDALPGDLLGRSRDVALSVGARTADARIAERTPWGSYSVVGVGAPPFALDDVEVAVPVP